MAEGEANFLQRKNEYEADRDALLALGLPLETVKRLAGWQPRLDYDTYAESQVGVWPPGAPVLPPTNGQRAAARLFVARSAARVNSDQLDGATIDAGTLYAVFVQDIPEINIQKIVFKLDGVTVHTEFSTPWDYAGTTGGGDANRVTFVAGPHTIDAEITDQTGVFNISASFEVE